MAWQFGDSFDLYAAAGDALTGYWDSGSVAGGIVLGAGRFAGSQAIYLSNTTPSLVKSSGVNDAVHHLILAFRQTAAISGSTLAAYLQLLDGVTGQCAVVFRSDGAILLTSGTAGGAVLATYTGAFPVTNTWYAFEIEVFISNTAGYMNVRKNGNNVNDFTSATNLNTRVSANNYANKLTVGVQTNLSTHQIDDLYWRSDASSVPWMGDIRCYTRMPASDQSVQFSRTPMSATVAPLSVSTFIAASNVAAQYSPHIAPYDGTVGALTVLLNAGYTGNMKCSMFNGTAAGPTTILASATTITNPSTGTNTFTFGTPFTVVKGSQYWVGFESDTVQANCFSCSTGNTGKSSTTTYAAFPVASPTVSNINAPIFGLTISINTNNCVVNEAQQDGTTSYVYDSTVNDADFYGIAAIASTPVATIAVTTRGYMQKSDAGTRTAAVQLKSGASTVASPTLTLTTSGWQWAWRTDTVDPNTSAAWTAAAVNNCNIGPKVIA